MKDKIKKLMVAIVGFFGVMKSNIVKAISMTEFKDFPIQSYYGVKKVPDYSLIMFFSFLISIPIVLIMGLIIYIKRSEKSKKKSIIIKIIIVLLAFLLLYLVMNLVSNVIL